MKRRFVAIVWKRDPRALHSYSSESIGARRTLESARRLAQSYAEAHPVITTNALYHRDVNRADQIGVDTLNRDGSVRSTEDIEPTVHVVPSVGELGYW